MAKGTTNTFKIDVIQCFHNFPQEDFQQYGIDWEGPLPEEASSDGVAVEVPETHCPVTPHQYQELVATVDPLRESDSYGIDIYLETLTFVNTYGVFAP